MVTNEGSEGRMTNNQRARKGFRSAAVAAFALSLGLASLLGCSGSSTTTLANGFVTIMPGPTQVGTGGNLQIFAEASPAQVTWAITGGTGCTGSGCGTLSAATSTSVTYLGPAAIAGTSATFTLTATSTANSSLKASQTYTIFPVAVTITGPTNTTVQPLTSASFTAVVNGDPTTNGVSWSVSGANCSGVGLAYTNCGTLTHSTTTSVTYTAPAAPAAETILVTATSIAFPGTNSSYVVSVPKLSIYEYSPKILPAAIIGQPYSATVQVTGNTPPYTYNPSNLPAWATFTPSPDSSSFTITGTPPAASQGTTDVLVSTADSASPADLGSQYFALSVYPAAATGNNLLSGSYAFYGSGWLDGTLGAAGTAYQGIAYVGSFTADGNGNITGGELDTNNFQTGLTSYNQLAGTYNIQYAENGSGTPLANFQTGFITLILPGSAKPLTLAISLRGIQHGATLANDLASTADFIEFDDTTGDGASVTGNSSGQRMYGTISLQKSAVLSQTASPFQGGYAFGMTGNTSQAVTIQTAASNCFGTAPPTCGPVSLAGVFNVSSTGIVSGGEEDVMIATNYFPAAPGSLSGSFANGGATDASGRMTASIPNATATSTGVFSSWPSNYIAYAVDNQHFYFMSADTFQTFSNVVGTATYQQPTVVSFPIDTSTSLALYSSVVSTQYFTGGTGPNGKVRAQVQVFNATANASGCSGGQYGLQGPQYQNLSGSFTTATVGSIGNYCNTLAANGRLLPASTSTGEAEPIIYLTDTNTGYGTQWNTGSGPGLWFIQKRTGTSLNAGTYSDSMVFPTSIQGPLEVGAITVPTGGVPANSKTAVNVTGTIYSQFSSPSVLYSSDTSMLTTTPVTGTLTNSGTDTVNSIAYTGIFLKGTINLLPANSFQACSSGYGFVITSTSFMCIDTVDQFSTPHLFQQ
jgi:hypothetical protein